LILTFSFAICELIEQGYIYIALPPLYLLKKGKEERFMLERGTTRSAYKDAGERWVGRQC